MNTEKILAICLSPDQGGLELYFIKLIKYYKQLGRNIHVSCSKKSYISQIIADNNHKMYLSDTTRPLQQTRPVVVTQHRKGQK